MIIVGNICIALSVILFLFPLQVVLSTPLARGGDALGGNLMSVTLVLIPMLLLVTVSLCAVASEGGLDWIGWQRGALYTLAVTVGLTLVVLTWFSAAMRGEASSQMRWVVRPFVRWAAYAANFQVRPDPRDVVRAVKSL